MQKKNVIKALLAFMLFSTLLMTQTANAADLFTVPDTDKSKLWFLDVLFPDDLSKSPLASTMTILNSAVLLVGGILAAYTLIAGTMSTAHDGEMLGKKWSSMWLPVRTALGTAMILPAAGGFCAAQVAVIWLITQGVGLADTIWNQYASNPSDGAVITTSASNQQLDYIAKMAFFNNVCMIKAQEKWASASARSRYSSTPPKFTMTRETKNYLIKYSYGSPTENNDMNRNMNVSKSACGLITLTDPDAKEEYDSKATSAARVSMYGGLYGGYIPTDIKTNISAVVLEQDNAFKALDQSMNQLAKQYVADNNIDLQAPIDTAVSTYISTIDTAVRKQFNDGSKWDSFKENVQQDGWFMAGAWSMKLIRIQDGLNASAHNLPVISDKTLSYKDIYNQDFANIMDKVVYDMKRNASSSRFAMGIDKEIANQKNTSGKSKTDPDKKIKDASELATSVEDAAKTSITGPMSSYLVSGVVNGRKEGSIISFSSDSTTANLQAINPILAAKGFGDALSTAGWALLGTAGLAGGIAGGGATAFGNWVSGALDAMLVALPIVIPLWLAGDMLAVVIPMMPYIMWFGVCVGWIILCLEAVIAAPLWVVVHLHPDGDGVVGRGGAGYGLVLSLTIRPALMIIGLISAYTIMPIIGNVLNESFSGAFGMVASGITGPIAALAFIAIYITMMLTVVKKSLSLIHVVPDEILKWLGVNGGQGMAAHAQSASKAVESAVFTQTALNQTSQALNGGRQKLRDIQAKNQADKQKEIGESNAVKGRASETAAAFRAHMSSTQNVDQQNANQSLQTAHSAYEASEAAKANGDTNAAETYGKVAQQAANRTASLNPDNKALLPQELQKNLEIDSNAGEDIQKTQPSKESNER